MFDQIKWHIIERVHRSGYDRTHIWRETISKGIQFICLWNYVREKCEYYAWIPNRTIAVLVCRISHRHWCSATMAHSEMRNCGHSTCQWVPICPWAYSTLPQCAPWNCTSECSARMLRPNGPVDPNCSRANVVTVNDRQTIEIRIEITMFHLKGYRTFSNVKFNPNSLILVICRKKFRLHRLFCAGGSNLSTSRGHVESVLRVYTIFSSGIALACISNDIFDSASEQPLPVSFIAPNWMWPRNEYGSMR